MAPPAIALCTTVGNRLEHLKQTLGRNLHDNRHYPNLKAVVLDYASTEPVGEWIAETFPGEVESGRLVYYRHDGPQGFRMAHAKNMAHRLGMREGADILANIDADNFTGVAFAHRVAQRFEDAEMENEAIFLRPRENHFGPAGGSATARMPWGCGGRIVISKQAFLATGGYDEAYERWGPDDKDLAVRLIRLGYARQGLSSGHLAAIYHDDQVRFAGYHDEGPKDIWAAGAQFKLEGREKITVVNAGRIGCGIVTRNFDPTPIEIAPMPSRIFGIGMHKTASTSLAAALRIMGFDAAHWISPTWAHKILDEFLADGRSATLAPHYAACDLPIGLVDRQLDGLYPGAKFILTIREEGAWLRSVEAHFARYTGEWNKGAFSHFIHRETYGRKTFDAEVFLARYRRHNAEVLEHFRDRPADLLVMDMSRGAGWDTLAPFVGQLIPAEPYPVEFVTPKPKESYPS